MSKETTKIATSSELKLVEADAERASKALSIKSDADAESVAEILIHLKTQVDTLEEKRKSYTQPINESLSRLNADFKLLTSPRNNWIEMLKEKVVMYVAGRKAEVKTKEKEVQKELKDRSLVLEDGLNKIVCSSGELRFRRSVDIKIVNKNLVPEKFWILDTKSIEKAMDDGEDVPGVKIKIEPIGSVAIYSDKK